MAAKTKVAGAAAVKKASDARPYVQRLVEDDELRDNLRDAYESGRSAYGRASGAKRPSDVLEDKKLQKELRNASESLRAATDALREPEKKGGSTLGRLLLLAIVGAVLALALSEELRKTVLDKLFGAEEEFEYTSTTSSASETSPAA